ncbi:MAG: hypothetical protein IK088_02700 [Lachnospiraceae bacterium]|nr:hypothetical protein [Lachnospiraceae bacterium]
MTINVYEQYFAAEHEKNGVPRKGALVMLVADSGGGEISYKAAVTFFPHRDEEDFAVSYDDYMEKELFAGKGRRSRKREAAYLKTFRDEIDALTSAEGGVVFWDEPLQDARVF